MDSWRSLLASIPCTVGVFRPIADTAVAKTKMNCNMRADFFTITKGRGGCEQGTDPRAGTQVQGGL